MARCFIFNPENDQALANGSPAYTPPRMSRRLGTDLAALPLWFLNEEDAALVADVDQCRTWLESLPIKPHCQRPLSLKEMRRNESWEITPWGWSDYMVRQLEKSFIASHRLPSFWDIAIIRTRSHRNTSIDIHSSLAPLLSENLIPEECSSIQKMVDFLRRHGEGYIKAPWSSSGQGVFHIKYDTCHYYYDRIRGILDRQGSVMCERALDKVLDFAVEFESDGYGSVRFAGYSVFGNDSRGSYDHGVVASTDTLRSIIDNALGNAPLLDAAISQLEEVLSHKVGNIVNGWLGVDMMVYRTSNGTLALNPCVELNLRSTMGAIASVIGNRHIAPGSQGKMYVRYFKEHRELEEYAAQLPSPITQGNYLVGGSLLLTPIMPTSLYLAHLTV